jgi:hypothetical protein
LIQFSHDRRTHRDHGRLAIELLNAAETITGEIDHIAAVSLGWHDDVGTAATMIQKGLERVNTRRWSRHSHRHVWRHSYKHRFDFPESGLGGNCDRRQSPMLIKLAQVAPDETLSSVARMLRDTAQSSIYIASELLAPKKPT